MRFIPVLPEHQSASPRTSGPFLLLLLSLAFVLVAAGCGESSEATVADAPESLKPPTVEEANKAPGFEMFPEPEDIGPGWTYTDGLGQPKSDNAENVGDTRVPGSPSDEYATIDQLNAAACDETLDVGPLESIDDLDASYTSPGGDQVFIQISLMSEENRAYAMATEDYLTRCVPGAPFLPEQVDGNVISSRHYETSPSGFPQVLLEIDGAIVWVNLLVPANRDSDVDILAIAQLIADRV